MAGIMENREEIIFLYDATNSNPNGDPDEENRPREDPVTGKIMVTDLRIKRTMRDFIDSTVSDEKNQILVKRGQADDLSTMQMDDLVFEMIFGKEWKEKKAEYEKLKKGKEKLISMATDIRKGLLTHAWDVRTFGSVTTLDNFPWTFTGALQFSLGMSLNVPNIREIPISPIVATKEAAHSGSLGNYKVVDYALIAVPGIACPSIAKENGFTNNDLELAYNALWKGTMALQSRSKVGQVSRLLCAVQSKNGLFQVGGLAGTLEIEESDDRTGIDDCIVLLDKFVGRLVEFKDQIEKIKLKEDPDLRCTLNGKSITVKKALEDKGFLVEGFAF